LKGKNEKGKNEISCKIDQREYGKNKYLL